MSSDTINAVPSAEVIEKSKVEQAAAYIEYKADLIYGPSDSGKTVNVGKASDYVISKYGKLSRLVTADGGSGLPGKAKSGQMETWAIGAWKEQLGGDKAVSIVLKAMQRAVEGYWPARLDDPESVLLAPDAGTWEIYGLYAYEGLTSFGDNVMMNLKSAQASLSQDPSYVYDQGGVKFAGGNRAYFGFTQDQLFAWVALSHLLPCNKVLWTALETRGDDNEGQPIYGPAIAGKKSISKAPQWFKNTIHIDIVNKPSTEATLEDGKTKVMITETERIMWLRTHSDNMTKINFPAKIRVPIEYAKEVPPYIIPPDIAKVWELIDSLEIKQAADSTGKMNEIEGVRERLLKAAQVAKERQEKAAVEKAKRQGAMPSIFIQPLVGKNPSASMVTVPPPVTGPLVPSSNGLSIDAKVAPSAPGGVTTGVAKAEDAQAAAATAGQPAPARQSTNEAAPVTLPLPGSVPTIQPMRRAK